MEKYRKACEEIDKIHKLDKTIEIFEDIEYPSEFLYANRFVKCLEKLAPQASEHIKLAARCQHFKRWEIVRVSFPMDKVGYLKWRKALYFYQSDEAAKILESVGYNNEFIEKVKILIQKKEINKSPENQLIEDIACLVFLEFYLENFSTKHEIDKLKSIISKTWAKMSKNAKYEALKIDFGQNIKSIILEAIKP